MGWNLEQESGLASQLHALAADATSRPDARRTVTLMEATSPAIVLGSAQPDEHVDRAAADRLGVEVARRRSGGGAVLVTPASVLWVDVLIPAGDPLWDQDVGRAALWVGTAWTTALEAIGTRSADVWTGRLAATEWSSRVCFAGVAPGEVLVNGKKAIGISQRRTRFAALFQTAVLLEWHPEDLLRLLALDDGSRRRAEQDLVPAATPVSAPRSALLDAFVAALPG